MAVVAANTLQSYVSNLRRILGPVGTASPIERVGDGYRLAVDAGTLVATRFEALVAAAIADDELAPLDEALALWHGPALADFADEAWAVGDAVRASDESARVIYVGTARGIEARVMPEGGDTLELLDIRPLRGGGLRGFMTGAVRAAASIPEARKLIERTSASVVLSVGGYAGGPVGRECDLLLRNLPIGL